MSAEETKAKLAELNLEADALLRYAQKLPVWREFTKGLLEDYAVTGGKPEVLLQSLIQEVCPFKPKTPNESSPS